MDVEAPKLPKRWQWLRDKALWVVILLLFVTTAAIIYLAHRNPSPPLQPIPTTTQATFAEPKIQLSLVATGLGQPLGIVPTNQPGDNRLFVVDRAGFIRIISAQGKVVPEPFLDISGQVLTDDIEQGLLGLAFSPHYKTDGFLFINYIDKNMQTVMARYHVSQDINKAEAASGQIFFTLKQPYPNHNGGDLVFGPDGYLYAALGDGGNGGDPQNHAQDTRSYFGKILRVDVSQIPYKVPADNPFAGQAGKLAEIWDYGLRNPWRISFDRKTHELYIADVGQKLHEEINIEQPGKGGQNYGWRCFEGNSDYNTDGCGTRSNYTFPVTDYDHSDGRCSITGGYVYRGTRYPSMIGAYFYGDYCSGEVWWGFEKAGKWYSTSAVKTPYKISTFGESTTGELYMADISTGSIYRLQDTSK